MKKTSILIVEDEAIIAMEIENQLQSLGYKVSSIVDTGERAIEKAEEDKPDLILMDIRIKGKMDGIDTAEEIRNKFGIPVIFSTAYLDEERIERAKVTMPFGYVLKPIQERDLKVTIEMALYAFKTDAKRKELEEERDRILNLSSDLICIAGTDGYFRYLNPAWEKMMGYTIDEMLSRPFFDFIHPDDHMASNKEIVSLSAGNETIGFENRYICKDDFVQTISWRATYVPELQAMYCIGRNITKRREAEEALQRANEELEQRVEQRTIELVNKNEELRLQSEIMTNMAEGVYLVSADDGIIVFTNPKFEKMFGYGPKEMIGKHVSIVNAPTDKDPKKTAEEIMGILNKTGIWQGEVHNLKKDGTPFWCNANVSVFDHRQYGKVLVAVHTDISDRKQAEEELLKERQLLD